MGDSSRMPPVRSLYRVSICGRFHYRCINACYANCLGDEQCRGDRQYVLSASDNLPVPPDFDNDPDQSYSK